MPEKRKFEFQLRMLEKGSEEIQKVIARLDELLFKVKAGAITVWVATIGWSVTIKSKELITIGLVVLLGFWGISATYRAVQIRYVAKARKLSIFMNTDSMLMESMQGMKIPSHLVYMLHADEKNIEKLKLLIKGALSPTVAVFYVVFVITNLLLLSVFEVKP